MSVIDELEKQLNSEDGPKNLHINPDGTVTDLDTVKDTTPALTKEIKEIEARHKNTAGTEWKSAAEYNYAHDVPTLLRLVKAGAMGREEIIKTLGTSSQIRWALTCSAHGITVVVSDIADALRGEG